MSTYQTAQLSGTGATFTFTRTVLKWSPANYPANAQVSVTGLNGGTFDLDLLPAGESAFKRHITAATETDLCMLAGKNAPLFEQLKVTVAGTSGATVTVTVTLWERGL